MNKTKKTNKTQWHRLLGTLLEQLLTPVGISVQCDAKIMSNPPEADILLLRRQSKHWTPEQKQRLADGIRDTNASHILVEFKYTESLNESALRQTIGYDYFYKRANNLSDSQTQSFLISSKTPRPALLDNCLYRQSEHSGIYISTLPVFRHIILIILNELSDEPHNAWIKCFASRRQQKRKAFAILKAKGVNLISQSMERFLLGLWRHWFNDAGEFEMSTELTAEKVMEMGKEWGDAYLSLLTPKERSAGLTIEERLAGLDAEERLAGLSIEEIEAYLQQHKSASK